MSRAPKSKPNLYQALFEASPHGLLLLDPQTMRALEFNDAACRQLGYSRDEFAALAVSDYDASQTPEIIRANIERIQTDGAMQFYTQHRTKDGSLRQVHIWTRPLSLARKLYFFAIHRDVGKQREAEAQLHRSLERFHRLVDTFSDIVFQLGADGVPVGENASWRRFTGQSNEDLTAGRWREAFHPDERQSVEDLWTRVLAEGKPVHVEARLRRADGQWRDVIVRTTPVRSVDGAIIEWVGTCTDITQSQQAERQVQYLNQLLNLTAQLAKIGGWALDVSTMRLTWTHQVYVLHELDPMVQPTVEEAIAFYAPEARPIISAAVQAAMDSGQPFDLELPLVTARGRRLWVRALGSCEQVQGRVTRVFGTIQDITERRHLDERSRLESAALSAAANAVVITDRAGIIRSVNTAFTRLTGYTEAEAVGHRPGDVLKSGAHDAAFFREFWETILAGKVWRGEITNRRKGGGLYVEEMVVTPVTDASGAITHFVAIKEDLTERRELERQLGHAQKMEAVGQLAGGVAHDFNNLLTVILSYAAFARAALPPDDPIGTDILEIESTAKRAADLTRQLLTFGRRSVVSPRALDLNAVVKGAYPLLRRSIGEDVELVTVLADRLGTVQADRVQIEQVLVNMAVNARDAMPAGGVLTIATENHTLEAAYVSRHVLVPPGRYVMLSVSDTGTGLSPEAQEHLFEPFFTTKPLGKGTGLGLATCFGIVRQSDGWIIPSSKPGGGTTFKVLLPRVADVIEDQPAPVKEPGYSGGTETVLVVEDARDVRRLIVRTLRAGGYRVLEASAGDEALRLSEGFAEPIDLLVTDIVMPGMRGGELGDRLRAGRPRLRTLYVSGYTPDTQTDFSRLSAGSAFLPKPFVGDELARTVRALLDRVVPDESL